MVVSPAPWWKPEWTAVAWRAWLEQGVGFLVLWLVHLVSMSTLGGLQRWSLGRTIAEDDPNSDPDSDAEAEEIYFLANTSNAKQRVNATFRVDGPVGAVGRAGRARQAGRRDRRAEWWDPLTGERTPAAVQPSGDGGLAAIVELEPFASRFLVFSTSTGSPGSSRRIRGCGRAGSSRRACNPAARAT